MGRRNVYYFIKKKDIDNKVDLLISIYYGNNCMELSAETVTYNFKPISMRLKCFVPNGPYDPDMLREALILFASNLFEECPSYQIVKKECEKIESMDLSTGLNVPEHFKDLLEESRKVDISNKARIQRAELEEISL